MQYSESSCIYLIELYTKEIHLYLFLNLDLANSFLTREFPDEGSACESRAFFLLTCNVSQSMHLHSDHPVPLLSQNWHMLLCSASTAIVQLLLSDKLQHI